MRIKERHGHYITMYKLAVDNGWDEKVTELEEGTCHKIKTLGNCNTCLRGLTNPLMNTDTESEEDWEDLIDSFKGTELTNKWIDEVKDYIERFGL